MTMTDDEIYDPDWQFFPIDIFLFGELFKQDHNNNILLILVNKYVK